MTAMAPLERVFGDHRVRIVLVAGEPQFVAADVCRALELANGRDAIGRLDPDGVGIADVIDSLGRTQSAKTVSEAGLYELAFQSRVPKAVAFRRWITHDVIPSLRKTGAYGQSDQLAALADPAVLRQLLGNYAERVESLQAANAELAPKAEVYDRIVDNTGTLGFREAAKVIHGATGVTEPEFRIFLLSRGWIQRLGGRLAPAHYGQSRGYVTTREREVSTQDGLSLVVPELRITQRGITRATGALLGAELAKGAG